MADDDPPAAHDEIADTIAPARVLKRCALCEECDDRRGDASAGAISWDHIPVLGSPAELISFPNLQDTQESHIAEGDGIVATYAFDEEVQCSLKGNHKHQKGVVVRTLCDMILCMGYDCGKRSIMGWEEIVRTNERRRRFHADRKIIDNFPSQAKIRLDDISRKVRARIDVVDTLRSDLPSLYQELVTRRRKPHGDEVHPSKQQLKLLPKDFGDGSTPLLVGLNILDSKQTALQNLAATLANYVQLERERPANDGPSAEALRKLASLFNDRAHRLEEWHQETAQFLTENNLNLALLALGRENSRVDREGNGWRMSYMWGESRRLPIGE